jgi:hypothetical protein
MLRKLTIALIVLAVAVLPLTATCVLAADGAQQTSHAAHLVLPFQGVFSGKYGALGLGATTYNGTGFFTCCGWSKVDGRQVIYPHAPFQMTIKTVIGDITLEVPSGSSAFHITGGSGCFAGASGSGHFSLHKSTHGTFTGCLDGNIVLA